jgi:hypothetical protein
LFAPDAAHSEADELVLELLVLATLGGLVEEVLLGAGRLFEAGVGVAGEGHGVRS